MYWAKNLLSCQYLTAATAGEAIADITIGPRNVLGTTPGNS